MTPDQPDPAKDAAMAEALLDEVGGLLRELRPQPLPELRLDSDIDRELGIDSLGRVELVVRLEQRFAVRLPSETFARVDTPRDLLDAVLVARRAPGAPSAAQQRAFCCRFLL